MKCLRKIFASGFLILASCFIIHHSTLTIPAFAQGEIQSSQNVLYQVSENGITHVKDDVTLTNTTTNYYASEYSLFLGFTDVKNISVFDSQGTLRNDIETENNGTNIHIIFNNSVVGKGKSMSFTISYDTGEVASQNGRIWEVDIPRIKESKDLDAYTTTLSVPSSFGEPSYIKPPSVKGLVFQKKDVLQGISVIFGNYQLFDYNLTYHLKNDRLYPVLTEIALPPSTAYQEVLLNTLSPAPLGVTIDKDGNWLAKYRLEASQPLTVKAAGKVKIFNMPQNEGVDETLADDSVYLAQQKYWETKNPKIAEKAKELKTPKAIYDYVVQTLTYDYGRIEKGLPRAGAAEVFSNPNSAVCMEFTDLFIALARAAGIPARELDGFAYTKNTRLRPVALGAIKDILHAWPEYYDKEKKMWIAVDPTWANTSGVDYFDSFDFSHFAFVRKGLDSEYPTPAGSYKEDADLTKQDVDVTFTKDNLFTEKRSITIALDQEGPILSGFPTKRSILITNLGNRLFTQNQLLLANDKLLKGNQEVSVTPIPPFGMASIPVMMRSASYFDSYTTVLAAHLGNEEANFTLRISPLYLVYLPWIGGGVGAALIFIFARKAGSLYLQRRKQKDSLRRQGK